MGVVAGRGARVAARVRAGAVDAAAAAAAAGVVVIGVVMVTVPGVGVRRIRRRWRDGVGFQGDRGLFVFSRMVDDNSFV